jgi:hypothetical protein
MVLEAPPVDGAPASSNGERETPDVEALIEEARRARRRRYRRSALAAGVTAAVVLAVVGILFALGDVDGGGARRGHSQPAQPPPASGIQPAETAPAGLGVVGRGPTSIDFTDAAHGWIASGNVALPLGNPTIVRTNNGGQTWQRTPVPNLAAQNVDPATRYQLGGLVGIHFANAVRGWFFQAGIAWQTNDGGVTWTKMHLPVPGAVVAVTSSDGDVWSLIDTCPIGAVSCPQNLAKGALYHATSSTSLTWRRVGAPLPGGIGTLYPAAAHSVLVALGPTTYHRSVTATVSVAQSTGCQIIGPLAGGATAGVCGGGGGGDASTSNISVSAHQGRTWKLVVGGPPSTKFMGGLTTNGTDAVFFVTGGQTLWRTSTSQPGWTSVLQAPQGSTDEIFPVYVEGVHGLALDSNGTDVHWFHTTDGGVTWQAVTLP